MKGKLKLLKKKIRRAPLGLQMPHARVEVVGPLIRVLTSSPILFHQFNQFLSNKGSVELDDGEVLVYTGWNLIEAIYGDCDSIEVWGPNGVHIEFSMEDSFVFGVFSDPDIQMLMKSMGGSLVAVRKPSNRKIKVKRFK